MIAMRMVYAQMGRFANAIIFIRVLLVQRNKVVITMILQFVLN